MSDRRRKAAPTNATVASAKVLGAAKRGAIPKPDSWQEEAWGYYDSIGEVRFACSWYANALSRVRLALAHRGQAGEEPVLLDADDPRNELIEDLAGGETGQSQLLASFAPHLVVPGLCYLVGVDDLVEGRTWRVVSYDEIAVKATGSTEQYHYLDGPKTWVPLPENSLPVQVWRGHARYHYQPDSPIRALLPVLRKLSLLMARDDAEGTSRLAGNGVFAIPSEATFPVSEANKDAEDPFLAEFMDAMLTPIGDRDAASAVVPLLMRVPGEHLDKLQHITFHTAYSDAVDEKQLAQIRRFANGMDIPAEVLLGLGDANHWTAWQIEEGAVKLHVVPMVETVAQALTVGWWRPMTQTAALQGDPIAEADDLIVWYDTSGLTARPDRSGDAKDLFAAGVIGAKALRDECGFQDEDAPTEEETLRSVILDIVRGAPSLAPVLLPAIGVKLDVPAGVEPLPTTGAEVPALPAGEGDAPADGPPERPTEAPSNEPEAVAASAHLAAADEGLVSGCEALVWRALERAGNKLRNAARGAGQDLSTVPPHEAHLHADATCLADLDHLLDGAWDRLPDLCARYDADLDSTRRTLDAYTRAMLAAQASHTYDRLRAAFTGS